MIDIVYGQTRNQAVARVIAGKLALADWQGTFYIGYPVLSSAEESIAVDALLVTREHGVVGLIFAGAIGTPRASADWQLVQDEQDKLYFAIQASLARHPSLRKGRGLAITINVVTIYPEPHEIPATSAVVVATPDTLIEVVREFTSLDASYYRPLNAALQRVTSIKPPKKRATALTANSRGSILKRIELEIANLDKWQKQAAIESPEGPQRVRGLAGSGKTVVLALKAAYLHLQNPTWKIAVTFHSRSLYQQLTDLIRRFSFEQTNDEPDWTHLRVLHSWGGTGRPGFYTEVADAYGATPRDFLYGKSMFGSDDAFKGICSELLSIAKASDAEPLYDVVLVDEAQDLPPSFLQLVYHSTRPPKRIVWAYDELQNLSNTAMPPLSELFGTDNQNEPLVSLNNNKGQAVQDVILPVCYRNTPWALTTAHSVGFGIYRKGGLVQHFDEPTLWSEIGYVAVAGNLEAGRKVTLERDPNSYPNYFQSLLSAPDAVLTKVFADESEQAEWIAEQIKRNIEQEELEHDDILVVLPNVLTSKKRSVAIRAALARRKIESHLAGVTSSVDQMFESKSIAISNIYRAKGNEAPMVYVADCQYAMSQHEQIKVRNTIFTAMTRSRAWLRLCGYGPEMVAFEEEVSKVAAKSFRLKFKVPTESELTKMRKIHRDRTPGEKEKIRKAEKGLQEFIDALDSGDIDPEMMPAALRSKLSGFVRRSRDEHNDAEED